MTSPYPAGLIPPPAPWKGEARHVAIADYEPEGTGAFMRLYFPTDERPPTSAWSVIGGRRPAWKPALAYSRGMLHFIVNFDKRPWWQRALLTGVYVTMHAVTMVMNTLPVSTGGPVKDGAKMPLIVFSHGLAGHRNMYAVLCSALASQGYIVAAMEHRDGSASCASVVDADGVARHKAYVHTEPPNFDWRREQIAVRTRELDAAIAALSSPAPPKNVFPGSTFDASTLRGAVDVSRLTAMGHSFGGATVVAAMRSNTAIRRVVLLDPWVEPFGACAEGVGGATHPLRAAAAAKLPTFVMNSHRWGADLRPFYQHADAPWMECEVAGTRHQDCSDLPFRMPSLAKIMGMRGSVDLHRLFDLKLALIDAFFEATEGRGGAFAGLEEAASAVTRAYNGEMEIRLKCSPA